MSGHRKPGCNRAGPPGDQGREWRPVQRCGDCVFQCTGFLLLRKRAESERPCGEIRRLRLHICAQLSALRPGQCTPDWGYQHRLLGRGRSAGIQPSGKLCDFRPGREPLFRSGSACCGKIHRCRIALCADASGPAAFLLHSGACAQRCPSVRAILLSQHLRTISPQRKCASRADENRGEQV